jgi:NAD(P)-dependent dehydrogenase (short-subunit alcohol dehydrogenase family)
LTVRILEGKVALVTGAGQGIGEAAAMLIAQGGAAVVVTEISAPAGERTAERITKAGGRDFFVHTDVSQEDHVAQMIASAERKFGRPDCAFNSAGFGNLLHDTAELDRADWDRVHGVVLRGTVLCMKYQIPAMLAAGGGAIVNNSYNAGLRAVVSQSAYSAAKVGVIGLSRTAAME